MDVMLINVDRGLGVTDGRESSVVVSHSDGFLRPEKKKIKRLEMCTTLPHSLEVIGPCDARV